MILQARFEFENDTMMVGRPNGPLKWDWVGCSTRGQTSHLRTQQILPMARHQKWSNKHVLSVTGQTEIPSPWPPLSSALVTHG